MVCLVKQISSETWLTIFTLNTHSNNYLCSQCPWASINSPWIYVLVRTNLLVSAINLMCLMCKVNFNKNHIRSQTCKAGFHMAANIWKQLIETFWGRVSRTMSLALVEIQWTQWTCLKDRIKSWVFFSIKKNKNKKMRPSLINKGRRNGKEHSFGSAISSFPTPYFQGSGSKYLKIKQNKINIHLHSLALKKVLSPDEQK